MITPHEVALAILNARTVSVATQQVAERVLCEFMLPRVVVPAGTTRGKWANHCSNGPSLMVDPLTPINVVLAKYLGLLNVDGTYDLAKAVLTYPDQFYATVDLRHLARALGGEWTELVDRVEKEAAERKANTKAYEAGAGIVLDKENG